MVDADVSCGVVPLETGILGVIVPKQMIFPAVPETVVWTEKWVSVSEPAVAGEKAIVATGLVDWAVEAVQPPVVRATVARP
jgi:hypothetical protein